MLKREPFYIVAVFLIAVFMTAGCAKQDVVKKDEGIAPAPAARQANQPKSDVTPGHTGYSLDCTCPTGTESFINGTTAVCSGKDLLRF